MKYNEFYPKENNHLKFFSTEHEAILYHYDELISGQIICDLCPRHCKIQKNSTGFCKVRKNIDGKLYAQSYGKATHFAMEKIETEAIYHALPGSKILSMGNFGCNLNCLYCQNWVYSQFEYTPEKEIFTYSADQVVDFCVKNNVRIISWTYNDPAVWLEFVLDVSKKAKKEGILILFKSAFYLTSEAIDLLLDVVDIFAVSIKSMDEEYYKKFTFGTLPPVLEGAKKVYKAGKHIEISNLVVTGISDNNENYDKIIDFVLNELGPEVPLHFTRFHPDYKYTEVEKTSELAVIEAVKRARNRGIKYAYTGNMFETEYMNTYCMNCNELLVKRIGLEAYPMPSLSGDGRCKCCNTYSEIKLEKDFVEEG